MEIILRPINNEDISLLYKWLNSPDSLKGKIQTKNQVSFSDHSIWFKNKLKEKTTLIWIIENHKNFPLGQIRFENKVADYLDVDIYLIKRARAKGIAQKAFKMVEKLINKSILRAEVKKNNIVSYNFFINCEFKILSEDTTKWIFIKNNNN